ncbi:MAG TPA: glycosyltransferase [Pseudolysinimonas sp.]
MTDQRVLVIGVGDRAATDRALAASCSAIGWDFVVSADLGEAVAAMTSSSADVVAFVTAGGEILPPAASAAAAFGADPGMVAVYGDGEVRAGLGNETIRRPVPSPERLRCQYYWGDLVLYRRSSVVSAPPDTGLAGAELYDLALRTSRTGGSILHVDEAIFRTRAGDEPLDEIARASTRRALEAHLAATGGGEVRAIGADGVHDTIRPVKGEPLVSLIIPTRARYSTSDEGPVSYLLDAVRSIEEHSSYRNFELVLVVDAGAEPEILTEVRGLVGDRLSVVEWAHPFNFSGKINAGVLGSMGDFVLLLNDDVQVIDADWIERLLALAQLPGSGGSGALLYYEDGTVQHAGHAYFEDDASHIGLDAAPDDPGPLQGYRVEREVSGVTAACMMVSREAFFEVGGMTTLLPGAFNDVDFCMKLTWVGRTIYWTPHARLYHFESKSRDAAVHGFEVLITWGRWGHRMHDPSYWPYPHSRTPHRLLRDNW